jgi:dTDP-4-dehydrorhamnose reductase
MTGIRRVMITGAAGQLGSTIVSRMTKQCEVEPFSRSQLDIADERAVMAAATSVAPDAIINCAAYNDVDRAEDDPMAAMSANALSLMSLSRAAVAVNAVLVHYSTDFVFDGNADTPYTEDHLPKPLSTYGTSKLLGEWFALEAPSAYVLRVESLFGGHPAKSSIDKIIAAILDGRQVRAFADRTVTPSYVEDVSAATEALLAGRAPFGIYHCVNSGVTTWLGVAEEISRLLGRDAEIIAVRSDSVGLRAVRPRYCALSNQKLAETAISMPTWQDALKRYRGSLADTAVDDSRASG